MILQTPRLKLRPYADEDFAAVHDYARNPAVCRYMLWGPNTEDETREFLRSVKDGAAEVPRVKYDFAIELAAERKMIGGCGIYRKGDSLLTGEIGYVLNPDYHRRGLTPEVVSALIDLAFGTLGLHRVFARCHPENRPSARVMVKCGMQYEGRLRETELVKGEWWDYLYYSLLEHEWTPH